QGWAGYVAALESTRYLRNQLLRDADWASMAHSLELRTPLADHVLTRALAPYAHQLVGGVGKSCLARAPIRALPLQVANASKTGFGLPIGDWITRSPSTRSWHAVESLRRSNVHWARRWAHVVASEFYKPTARAAAPPSERMKLRTLLGLLKC